jgi:hypothetical protein
MSEPPYPPSLPPSSPGEPLPSRQPPPPHAYPPPPHAYPPPQQPYGAPQQVPVPPAAGRGTNIMAILSLVFAFVFAPAGIVLGHLAKKQIRQTGEQGEGLATAGLVVSYIFTGITVIACCAGVVTVIIAAIEPS